MMPMGNMLAPKAKKAAALPSAGGSMPRDPELMAKLDHIRRRKPEEVSLEELLEMCVLLERHENDQHLEYSRVAREQGREDIARIFEELALGEKFYHERMAKAYGEEVRS